MLQAFGDLGYLILTARIKGIVQKVVNKLYPISSISWQIEAFAKEMLVSAAKYIPSIESNDPNGAISEQEKESNMGKFSSELPFSGASSKELSVSNDQLSAPQSISSLSLPQDGMSGVLLRVQMAILWI